MPFARIAVSVFIAFTFLSSSAFGGIINPDFEQGLDSWIDLSSGGSVSIDSGAAVLSGGQGADPFSAVLTQGDDGSFSFENPISIPALALSFRFDLWLLSQNVDTSESGASLFADSLTLAFYDQEDMLFDLIFPSLSYSATPFLYSFDISSLAGRNVSLSFELADADDGFNLALALDNFTIVESLPDVSVPAPGGAGLLLIGLFSLILVRRLKA